MLAANVCAADFVMSNELPALYRNHEGPRDEKLSKLRNYLGILGIQFTAGKKPQPADFQKVLGQIEGRPDAHIVQAMLLRSLTQAVYAPDNVGHFGLAYEAYAHFTSPIRRYPDLLLHRAIRHKLQSLAGVKKTKGDSLPDKGQMVAYGEHCSMTERRADEATRDVVAWLKCEYMQSRVGEEFEGVISGVTTFGFFVELTDIYVEGLVHVSHLKSDYYEYDSISQRLIGSRSGIRFSLGDAVRIKVAGVDLDNRKMDFELVHKTGAFNESSGKESFGKESSEKENKLKKGDAKKSPVKKESSVRDRLKKGEVPPMGVAKEHVVGKQKGGVTKPSKTKPKKSAKPKAAKGSAKKAVKKK